MIDKFPKGKVKMKLYLYEAPDCLGTPFTVIDYKFEAPPNPYLGEVEVEFDFPVEQAKENLVKEIDRIIEKEHNTFKARLESLENMKKQLEESV